MGASPEASTTGPGVSVLPCEPPCTAVALAVSFCDLEEGALSSRDVSLGFAGHSDRSQNPQDIPEEKAGPTVAEGQQEPQDPG